MKFCKFKLENVCRKFSSQVDERQAKLMAKGLPKRQTLTDVTDIVVIASGKGGVGKSTTSGDLNALITVRIISGFKFSN